MNQIVRWVNNKDQHADELSEIVTYYFMAQRTKAAPESDAKAYSDYVKKLTLLHQMVVHSMQASRRRTWPTSRRFARCWSSSTQPIQARPAECRQL